MNRGKFEDEITPLLKHTGAGILSMANSGPNTNGSQFFVTLAPTPWLDGIYIYLLFCIGKHTIFGRISAGMKTIQKMSYAKTDENDRPIVDVVINSATVIE